MQWESLEYGYRPLTLSIRTADQIYEFAQIRKAEVFVMMVDVRLGFPMYIHWRSNFLSYHQQSSSNIRLEKFRCSKSITDEGALLIIVTLCV